MIIESKVLAIACSEEDGKRAMLYSYKKSFSGFSAKLNASQAIALSSNYKIVLIKDSVWIDFFFSVQKRVFK